MTDESIVKDVNVDTTHNTDDYISRFMNAAQHEKAMREIKCQTEQKKPFVNLFVHKTSPVHVNVRRSSADDDKLMFQFEDIAKVTHPLARFIRAIFVDLKITHAEFDERHRIYCERAGLLTTQINYSRNNIKKALYRDRLSFSMFETVAYVILGLDLNDMIYQFTHPDTSELLVYSLKGIQERVQQYYAKLNDTDEQMRLVASEDV